MRPLEADDRLAALDPSEVYNHFLRRKASGEVFDWSTITREDLRRLSWDYDLLDAWIGEIYGVSKRQVMDRRSRWDLQLYHRNVYKAAVQLSDLVDQAAEAKIQAIETAAPTPFESRFTPPNGNRWHLTLDERKLRITRTSDEAQATTWSATNRRDAELLLATVRKGPESDIVSWLEMFDDAFQEIAAAYDDFEDGVPQFLGRERLEEREQAWLVGSLRIALALWPESR